MLLQCEEKHFPSDGVDDLGFVKAFPILHNVLDDVVAVLVLREIGGVQFYFTGKNSHHSHHFKRMAPLATAVLRLLSTLRCMLEHNLQLRFPPLRSLTCGTASRLFIAEPCGHAIHLLCSHKILHLPRTPLLSDYAHMKCCYARSIMLSGTSWLKICCSAQPMNYGSCIVIVNFQTQDCNETRLYIVV